VVSVRTRALLLNFASGSCTSCHRDLLLDVIRLSTRLAQTQRVVGGICCTVVLLVRSLAAGRFCI
jgi:hypothetical protein